MLSEDHGLPALPPRKRRVAATAHDGAVEVEASLTHLAVGREVASATPNRAMKAIALPYKQVLKIDPESYHAVRVGRRGDFRRFQAVTRSPPIRLIVELGYGGGRRVGTVFSFARTANIAWLDAVLLTADFTRAYDALHTRRISRRLHDLATRGARPYSIVYAGKWCHERGLATPKGARTRQGAACVGASADPTA